MTPTNKTNKHRTGKQANKHHKTQKANTKQIFLNIAAPKITQERNTNKHTYQHNTRRQSEHIHQTQTKQTRHLNMNNQTSENKQ